MAEPKLFGKLPNGESVWLYEITNGKGLSVEVITFGATMRSLYAPSKGGKSENVILGAEDLEGYLAPGALAASVIGRFANRINNNAFSVNGKATQLEKTPNGVTLHGGTGNYGRRNFAVVEATESQIRLALVDHGEDGFPGEVAVRVIYTVTPENGLQIEYRAVPKEDTPLNLTNHVYFNLAGQASGVIDGQTMQLESDFYTPTDKKDIPTGEILATKGTPFDFTKPVKFADAFPALEAYGDWHHGYDQNFLLRGEGFRYAGAAEDPASGRRMEFYTDLPAVQLYTANAGAQNPGREGAVYPRHAGFCLETQTYPDAPNQSHFPLRYTRAGEFYHATTVYKFSVK